MNGTVTADTQPIRKCDYSVSTEVVVNVELAGGDTAEEWAASVLSDWRKAVHNTVAVSRYRSACYWFSLYLYENDHCALHPTLRAALSL